MRLAWFSPMPPVPSGIAACSAQLVDALAGEHDIDVFVDEPVAKMRAADDVPERSRSAHEFLWRHRSAPYDLTVYQLGNSSHHDYLWPYLFRYPGLTVLHDAHLHHARAAALLRTDRADDYRAEFAANHPGEAPDLAELAVAGFDSHIYYAHPMIRLVVESSRMTAVHTVSLANGLNEDVPGAAVRCLHLGHGELLTDTQVAAARRQLRRERRIPDDAIVFGVFGGLTPEKRVPQVLDAFEALLPYSPHAHLLLAGAPANHYDVAADVGNRGIAARVTITGYLETEATLTQCIAACDVALNLRWPTAREMSGPWLRALAAGRPTIITDLEHLAHVPSLDPRTWRLNLGSGASSSESFRLNAEATIPNPAARVQSPEPRAPSPEPRVPSPVTIAVDVMDEAHSLRLAMRRLAADPALRAALGSAGRAYWQREHSPARMLDDYRAAIAAAAALPVPDAILPGHLLNDGDDRVTTLLGRFGVAVPFRRSGHRMTMANALWDKL